MKKVFLTVLLAAFLAAVAVWGAPRVVEAFQEADFTPTFPTTETIVTLNFSVDTACAVQFISSGRGGECKTWLVLDSDSLPTIGEATYYSSLAVMYVCQVEAGEHTVLLKAFGVDGGLCENAYLQALIFEPDEPSAVVELPVYGTPTSRAERVYRVGDLIGIQTLDAAVYDASGRLVERPLGSFAPESAGVYYITGEEHIRKIVVQ
ncbi:hypothetical protein GF359_05095 [candidate division WOR-3 bacterium]|uniref:T9SS type A sorting domain-containing protein n=1 Tax=candidate division WOR-3 bacterium TaxID=2052148 RepID=A0A9D5QCZ6_UNCW3|nr:hypothetical protein [candidate division WOR-3 bacterium]MBD3364572.1 hypothetical protein [candidate division WOR-3 bacterium]